jgi:hypothetical protein
VRFKTALLLACLSATTLAGVAAAQAPATFLLRSGEKVQGDLIDLNSTSWLITVNGQERRLGLDDLAVVDFAGGAASFPSSETSKLLPGQNLLVLRNGQMFAGRMNDVGGTRPKRINFSINGEARDFTSDQVSRIYLASPPSATAATSGTTTQQPAAGQPVAVRVPASQAWTFAGVLVRAGEVLTFSSSGQVQLSTNATDTATVTGAAAHQLGARGSLPTVPGGALIGRIGNGKPFGIGDQTTITAPATGPLYLGVNDDLFTDNTGEFNVTVSGGTTSATPGVRRRWQ